MTLVWGAVLAAGLLLTFSPWLWPASEARAERASNGRLVRLLEEAGFGQLAPGAVVAIAAGIALAAGAVTFLIIPVPALAVVALAAGSAAPFVWLRGRRSRIMRARRALWPDICDLLIASVRAGMSLPDAVSTLSESAPSALRPAF